MDESKDHRQYIWTVSRPRERMILITAVEDTHKYDVETASKPGDAFGAARTAENPSIKSHSFGVENEESNPFRTSQCPVRVKHYDSVCACASKTVTAGYPNRGNTFLMSRFRPPANRQLDPSNTSNKRPLANTNVQTQRSSQYMDLCLLLSEE